MKLIDNTQYQEDLKRAASIDLPWERLCNKTILLSGASGMIGSFLVDLLMYCNRNLGTNCRILALGRNIKKNQERFSYCFDDPNFKFISHDINLPLPHDSERIIDFVVHLASNTHPVAYATDPVGTVLTNILGTKNMLEYAIAHQAERFAFASSNEIYGENRGDIELFSEDYCGYIDCNTLRAGYTESKRCGEALCQAYLKQYGLDIVIPRFTRTYGPTMLTSDTKVISQFILNALDGKDIVLKSAGTQHYSFTYVSDAVIGLLTVLLKGEIGNAYNIADSAGDIMLKDLAEIVAKHMNKEVVFDLPNAVEVAGFSKATKARLSGDKLKKLGWRMQEPIETGIIKTINILNKVIHE